MIVRLALRSLATRPLRTAVLSIGFGLGIAVMAELLGVGEVILQQAHSPALAGGGDVVLTGALGALESARFVMSGVLASDRFRARVRTIAPSRRATLYLVGRDGALPVAVRGDIPSREAAIGNPEVARQSAWTDSEDDKRWLDPAPGDLLRAMDRFHPLPARTEPSSFDQKSWAEWLYFNGRSADGTLRLYLTFLTTGPDGSGKRPAFVRLQLNRNGETTNYFAADEVDARQLLERAPNLDIGVNSVRLDESGKYLIELALDRESPILTPKSPLRGALVLSPAPGRSIPPATIHGARGWMSGYVVPVLSGTFSGRLTIDGTELTVDGASGYHDHNWGYWQGVSWQWGQVSNGDVSIIYGRVFPPADVADRAHVPGALAVIGRDGPIAVASNILITEEDQNGTPRTITIQSRDRQATVTLRLTVSEAVRTPMALTSSHQSQVTSRQSAATFLQLGGVYQVSGRAGATEINFTARGSAETFRY